MIDCGKWKYDAKRLLNIRCRNPAGSDLLLKSYVVSAEVADAQLMTDFLVVTEKRKRGRSMFLLMLLFIYLYNVYIFLAPSPILQRAVVPKPRAKTPPAPKRITQRRTLLPEVTVHDVDTDEDEEEKDDEAEPITIPVAASRLSAEKLKRTRVPSPGIY
jgi:hypothetical protein